MKKIVLTMLSTAFIGLSAGESTSYGSITDMKAWSTKIDVYLDIDHTCGGTDSKRYHLKKEYTQRYAMLLTGFSAGMKTSLYYDCLDEYPNIIGVRLRK
jgi:hypothetical protein